MVSRKWNIPQILLRPVPLFLYQPMLKRIVKYISSAHPELFSRLGVHAKKSFLINPTNMPFVLLLKPHKKHPMLLAFRDEKSIEYHASISGTFLTLLNLVDGVIDGDAIFFTRDLKVEGDTEAIVALRNALDNIDGSIADEIAEIYGSIGDFSLQKLRKIKAKA